MLSATASSEVLTHTTLSLPYQQTQTSRVAPTDSHQDARHSAKPDKLLMKLACPPAKHPVRYLPTSTCPYKPCSANASPPCAKGCAKRARGVVAGMTKTCSHRVWPVPRSCHCTRLPLQKRQKENRKNMHKEAFQALWVRDAFIAFV